MSTTTAPKLTDSQAELLVQRNKAVEGWNDAHSNMVKAMEAERAASPKSKAHEDAQKQRLSFGGKKANRRAEIRQFELDLRLEGLIPDHIEAWVEPASARVSNSRLLPMTQEEIQEKINKVLALMGSLSDSEATVKHDCEIRINGLKKAAEARGYTVTV